jgi:serine/threonine protein kinase
MILGEEYTGGAVDIWSSGVALFMMTTGRYPFASVSSIISCTADLSPVASSTLRDLFARIFVRAPLARITAMALATHPWLVSGRCCCLAACLTACCLVYRRVGCRIPDWSECPLLLFLLSVALL